MFNQTLNEQIDLSQNYNFSVNISYLNETLLNLNNSIQNSLNNIKTSLMNVKNGNGLYNNLRNVLNIKNDEKIKNFTEKVKIFFKNNEIEFLNYTINLEEYVAKFMKKEYNDYIFKYIYEYVEIFDNKETFFDYLNNDIQDFETFVNSEFKNIYDYYNLNYILNDYYESFNFTNITDENNLEILQEYEFIFKSNSEKLNSNILNISEIIKFSKKDESSLYNYLIKDFKLEYNLTLDDMSSSLEQFDNYRAYINNNKNPEYKNLLQSSLIQYYNESYSKFLNDYISEIFISNTEILINQKILLQVNILKNKLSDDFNFYKLLLNETNLIGISTKNLYLDLYDELKQKINETINEELENNLFFNLQQFKKNITNLLRNNYLSFYEKNQNKNILIHKSNQFIYDIIKEPKFNKTLDNIFDNIFNKTIYDKIYSKLNEEIYLNLNQLYNILDNQKYEIEFILNSINEKNLPYDMIKTVELKNEYNQLSDNYNLNFNFSFSNEPLLITNDFSNENLKPPLMKIKSKYNEIEQELLTIAVEKINNLEDFSSIVNNSLDLDNKITNISENTEKIKSLISEYFNFIIEDVDQYYCKLAYLTIIDNQEFLQKPENFTFCNASRSFFKNETLRRLYETENSSNISKYFRNIPELKESEFFNLKRKLKDIEGDYNSNSPALSKKDIIFFYLFFNETMNGFINQILSNQTEKLRSTFNNSINEILHKYLPNLKKTIDLTGKKFSTILTEDNLLILYNNMYYHYNKIENITQNYTEVITGGMNSFLNSLNNTRIIFDLIKNLIFNIIEEFSNELNYEIYNSSSKILISNKKLGVNKQIIKKLEDLSEEYIETACNKTQEKMNNIEKRIGEAIIKQNGLIDFIHLDNVKFLETLKKELNKNENYSLADIISKYALKEYKKKIPKG